MNRGEITAVKPIGGRGSGLDVADRMSADGKFAGAAISAAQISEYIDLLYNKMPGHAHLGGVDPEEA
ncbi:MAG: hypothetical protein ACLPX1_05715 [Steroidobacteraceae bacterium]